MKESLIDTDILSYYFRGDATVTNRLATYLDYVDGLNISINDSRNRNDKFCCHFFSNGCSPSKESHTD